MNPIIKKAGMSMLSGAACAFGSWVVNKLLNEGSKKIKQSTEKKREESAPA